MPSHHSTSHLNTKIFLVNMDIRNSNGNDEMGGLTNDDAELR